MIYKEQLTLQLSIIQWFKKTLVFSLVLIGMTYKITSANNNPQQNKIDSLISIINSNAHDTVVANSYISLSNSYQSSNTDSAIFWAERLITFAQQKKMTKFIGKGYITKGFIHRLDIKLEKTRESYLKALKTFQIINDFDGMGAALAGLMTYHKLINSITDSMQFYYNKILTMKDSIGDQKVIFKTYYNFAVRLLETEEYHLAMDNLLKSIAICEKLKFEKGLLYAKTSLAVIKYRLKNNDEAIKLYSEIAPKAKSLGLFHLYSAALKNLGVCYETISDFEKAQYYCGLAIASNEKHNIKEGTDLLCRNMGITKLNLGQLDSAIFYANKALGLIGGDPEYKHIINLLFADIYTRKKEFKKAEIHATKFLENQKKQNTTKFVSESYGILAALYEAWGKFGKACQYYKLHKNLQDSIFNENHTKQIANMEALYWSSQKRNELAMAKKNEELRTNEVIKATIENQLYASQRNGLIVALILVVIFSVLLYRINLQRRKNKLMQQVTELELKAIRAQMNPHFLFNALSAIQMLINKNDIKQSNIALAKFGKLMRLILENSEKQTVPLEDEIKILELYMQLEALRFSFNYSFDIDPKLDKENIQVPSMIIQPYIENAIKHGISNKLNNRNVNVSFKHENDHLFCSVEDDGVGREVTEANKSKYSQHKSMGSKLSKDRLELLGKQMFGKADIQIKDLHSPDGNPSGTRVELNIPIDYHEN